jgi:hypothetical protein
VLDARPTSAADRLFSGDASSSEGRRVVDSRHSADAVREADEALALLRSRFEHAQDPTVRGQIADEALGLVESQLSVARDWRGQLDSFEGSLWARRNRIERFLIRSRGREWWRARRDGTRR